MSQHSEDTFVATSDSFWEPGNYKRVTKRIEDGHRLCSEFMGLVAERAEIEKKYAADLQKWASKWHNHIEKSNEYGTTKAAWKAPLTEAEERSRLHTRIKEELNTRVNGKMKTWQKENYHKSMMTLKEKKEMDDQFKKAQKKWAGLLNKVNKAKAEYHSACKAEKSALTQERNATGDSGFSPEQLKKLQDRVQKCKDNVNKTRDHYEGCLANLNNENGRYMEDMTEVFEKCQHMEGQRLQIFKDTLFELLECLNISKEPKLPEIYDEFHHTVNNADHEQDLRWWSNTYGVNMAMNWPQFEEYTEEFREIGGKGSKKSGQIPDGSITLINQRHVGDDLPEYNPNSKHNGNKSSSKNGGLSHRGSADAGPPTSGSVQAAAVKAPATVNNTESNFRSELSNGGAKDHNPFDEEDWEDDPLVDHGEPGVKVRALYDYEAMESDEISFKTGDLFEKLEDEDEQGWCKGRKDGRVGLYPANYVEVVE